MAEIHVETKKHQSTPTWIWVLVTVVIIGLVAYFLTRNNTPVNDQSTGTNAKSPTSYVQPVSPNSFYLYAA